MSLGRKGIHFDFPLVKRHDLVALADELRQARGELMELTFAKWADPKQIGRGRPVGRLRAALELENCSSKRGSLRSPTLDETEVR